MIGACPAGTPVATRLVRWTSIVLLGAPVFGPRLVFLTAACPPAPRLLASPSAFRAVVLAKGRKLIIKLGDAEVDLLTANDEAGNPTRFYPSRTRGHGELPDPAVEDVDEDGVPIRPHDVTGVVRAGKDVEFVAPAGSLAIFTNHSKRILDLIAFAVWLTRRFRYQHCTGATGFCGAAASASSSSTALAEPTTRGRARVATHSPAAGRSSGDSSLRSRRASAASSTSRRQETSITRPTRSPRSSAYSPAGTTAASTPPRFRPVPPDR